MVAEGDDGVAQPPAHQELLGGPGAQGYRRLVVALGLGGLQILFGCGARPVGVFERVCALALQGQSLVGFEIHPAHGLGVELGGALEGEAGDGAFCRALGQLSGAVSLASARHVLDQ